ncbi:MAG: hypothetical protein P1V81_02755, partial [Planctomycetota bacterium]|nr:hypothetical protein [Planctomycetota bacterium]
PLTGSGGHPPVTSAPGAGRDMGSSLSSSELASILGSAGGGCPMGPCGGCPHSDIQTGACNA